MIWQQSPFFLPTLASAGIAVILARHAWQRRDISGARALTLLLLAIAEWSVCYALVLASPDIAWKIFWTKMQNFGIGILPVIWLAFTLEYTRREKWLTHRNLFFLSLVPAITIGLVFSNDFHHLVWRSIDLTGDRGFASLTIVYGSWFWVHASYSYLLTLVGAGLILKSHLLASESYRQQTAMILLSVILPWLVNIIGISSFAPFPNLDLTPIAFTLSGAAMAWGLFGFRLTDLLPLARSAALKAMSEGVIVLNGLERVIEINPAAVRYLDRKSNGCIGLSVEELFAAHPELLRQIRQGQPVSEVALELKEGRHHYAIQQSPFRDAIGRPGGRLLIIRDITEQKLALQAVSESETRFKLLTEATLDGVAITRQGIIQDTNPQFLEIFGYKNHPDEIRGKPALELIDSPFEDIVRERLTTGYDQTFRILAVRRDGTKFPAEMRGKSVDSNGHSVRISAFHDISQQIAVEEGLLRREAISQAVSFAAEKFLSTNQFEVEIPTVLERLGQATQSSRVYIFKNHTGINGDILNSQWKEWVAPGITPQIDNQELQNISFTDKLGRWQTNLGNGKPVYGNVRDFPQIEKDILGPQEILSLLVVPIRVANTWWGLIGFDDCQKERTWENVEIEALEVAASALGGAIQRNSTEEKLRRTAEELSSLYELALKVTTPNELPELLQNIVEQARQLLGGSGGGLYLADPERQEVKCVVSLNMPQDFTGVVVKYGEGAAGIVAETGKALLIKDYRRWPGRAKVYEEKQPFRSLISVPLVWKGSVTGVIHVLQNQQEDYFTRENQELLTLFASQAVIAIENARLVTSERRRVEELHALQETLADISSELDLQRLLEAIMQRAVDLLGATGGDLSLYRSDSQSLEVVVSYNLGRDYTGTRFGTGEGVVGLAFQNHQPVMVSDYQTWEKRLPEYSQGAWHAGLAVPLLIGGRGLGALGVVHGDASRQFSQNDVDLFSSFAQQAAIAIENANFFKDVQTYARRMTLLNDLTRTAISAPDLNKMLQRLADRLGELFVADDVFITLWNPDLEIPIPSAAFGQFSNQYPKMYVEPGEENMTTAVLRTGRVLVAEDVTRSSYVSPRIAAMFPTRAALGIPLQADDRKLGAVLISYNQPRSFSQDDILLGEQAGAQVALAIARAQSLEAEKLRTAELARANSIILALGRVAGRFEAAPDPDAVMETLGRELNKLGVHCLVALHQPGEPGLRIRYLSLQSRLIGLAERLARVKMDAYRITPEHFPFYKDVFENRQARISDDSASILEMALPVTQPSLIRRFAQMYGVTDHTRWVFLPLTAEDKVIGTLWMWGEMLEEAALPAASIFASQVAIALENARLYNEIQRLAITDDLTQMYNRRGLFELGQREVDRALRYNRPLTAIMLDIDHFKFVNDEHGHPLGDEVLRGLADICRSCVRDIDILARYGGEEFFILLPESELRNSAQIAERLRLRVAETAISTRAGNISITISLGVCELNGNIHDFKALIARSDQALYAAKHAGRNRVTAY